MGCRNPYPPISSEEYAIISVNFLQFLFNPHFDHCAIRSKVVFTSFLSVISDHDRMPAESNLEFNISSWLSRLSIFSVDSMIQYGDNFID